MAWWTAYPMVEAGSMEVEPIPISAVEPMMRPIVLSTQSFDGMDRVPHYVFIPSDEQPRVNQPVHLREIIGEKRTVRLGLMPDPKNRRVCAPMISGVRLQGCREQERQPVIRVKTSSLRRQAHRRARPRKRAASEDRFLDTDDSSMSSCSSSDLSSPPPTRSSPPHTRPSSSLSPETPRASPPPVISAEQPAAKRQRPVPVRTKARAEGEPEVPSFYSLAPITRGELDVERVRWLLTARTACLRQLLCITTRSENDRRLRAARAVEPLLRLSDLEYALSCQHLEMFVLALVGAPSRRLLDRLFRAERDVLLERMDACRSAARLERMLARGGVLGLQRSDDELDEDWVRRYGALYPSPQKMRRLRVERVTSMDDALRDQLRRCHLSSGGGGEFPREWYQTDWRNALEAVGARRTLLVRGRAYVSARDLKCYAADRFVEAARARVERYRQRLWLSGVASQDERLLELRALGSHELAVLRKHALRADRGGGGDEGPTVDIEDLVSRGPLCMVNMDRKLRKDRHLSHHERQQYAMTAIKSGCTAVSVTRRWFGGPTRWRHRTRVYDMERAERQVTQDYENYERKKRDYAPLSCYRINERDALGRQTSQYACPYSTLGRKELAALLESEGANAISPESRRTVMNVAVQRRDPVSACNAHLAGRIAASRARAALLSGSCSEPDVKRVAPISHTSAYYARLRQHVASQ